MDSERLPADDQRRHDAERLRVAVAKELDQIARLAERVSQQADYPIASADRLTELLGPDMTVIDADDDVARIDAPELRSANMFPIESKGDLLAKIMTTLARTAGSALAQIEGQPRGDNAAPEAIFAGLERQRPTAQGTLMFSSVKKDTGESVNIGHHM